MNSTLLSDEQIRAALLRYIADGMPANERASYEERLLADQEFSDAVAVCEQEIIDFCAAEKLSREDSTTVRRWIAASPRRTQRFRMAQALLREKQRKALSRRRVVLLAVAACLLVAAGLSVARFGQGNRRRTATSSVASSSTAPLRGLSGRTPSSSRKPVAATTLLLVAERTRGSLQVASYKIPQDVPVQVEVLLNGTPAGGPYELAIDSLSRSGQIVLERKNLSARRSAGQIFIDATFAAGSLPPDNYEARVSSGERVMLSRFTVTP